jgi:hypothetical protein
MCLQLVSKVAHLSNPWAADRAASIPAGSQLDHAFPETGGSERSREGTRTAPFEFTRALAEPAGHLRTPHQDGSGP